MTNSRTLHRSPSRYALLAACASSVAACAGDYALGDLSTQDQRLLEDATGPSSEQQADGSLSAALPPPDVSFGIETRFIPEPTSIATADIDGDGFEDVAMVEFDNETLTQFVHVRYGGPRPTLPEGFDGFGSRAGHFVLGESGARLVLDSIDVPLQDVASAGDVDGDGYADLIVSMDRCEPVRANEGLFLLYGGPERLPDLTFIDEVAVQLLRAPAGSAQTEGSSFCNPFAASLAGVGDLDGDGLDDFVVSNTPERYNEAALENGDRDAEAYLFYGRTERFQDGTAWTEADATLVSGIELQLAPAGDIDADGLADLFLGSDPNIGTHVLPSGLALLRGNSERLSGTIALDTVAQRIEGAMLAFTAPYPVTADLDGDGSSDVLLRAGGDQHLFYGGPGLFEGGVDFASSSVFIPPTELRARVFATAGDLDGDGDDDLVTQFEEDDVPGNPFASDIAVLSGSPRRLEGEFDFPIDEVRSARPMGMFGTNRRALEMLTRAGDLDGDGADDLITVSTEFTPLDELGSFRSDLMMLHIHYGTPGGTLVEAPR
jgi:hypothetical protein